MRVYSIHIKQPPHMTAAVHGHSAYTLIILRPKKSSWMNHPAPIILELNSPETTQNLI